MLDAVQKALGLTPNLFRVVAQSPAALEGLLGLNGALAQGVRSFTLNAHGQLTRTPLPLASRRVRVPAPVA